MRRDNALFDPTERQVTALLVQPKCAILGSLHANLTLPPFHLQQTYAALGPYSNAAGDR